MIQLPIMKIALMFGGIIFLASIGLIIWYFMKGGSKFDFMLWSRDGLSARIIQGKLKVDPENKTKRTFVFDNFAGELMIQPATLFIGKKNYREVTFSDDGELIYLKSKGISRDGYLERCLQPEERQLALFRLKENNRRYENPINKYQAIIMGVLLILTLLLLVGIIYVTTVYVKTLKNVSTITEDMKQVSDAIEGVTSNLYLVGEQQTRIMSALSGDINVTRQIT